MIHPGRLPTVLQVAYLMLAVFNMENLTSEMDVGLDDIEFQRTKSFKEDYSRVSRLCSELVCELAKDKKTLEEMREAVRGHLAVMRERGEPAPTPATVGAATIGTE